MTVATRRRCRTCPAIFEDEGPGDQCSPCCERSAAVRAAVQTPKVGGVPKPRARTCEHDGHYGCEHVKSLMRYLAQQHEEAAMCFTCGAEDDDDGNRFTHKPDCVFAPLDPSSGGPR